MEEKQKKISVVTIVLILVVLFVLGGVTFIGSRYFKNKSKNKNVNIDEYEFITPEKID